MGVYIYCPRPSQGALELVKALDATRLRKFDGESFWDRRKKQVLSPEDVVVVWGAEVPELDGVKVLNPTDKIDKFKELQTLYNLGIPCVGSYKGANKPDFNWVPRKFNHQGGNDLLNPPASGQHDFWVCRMPFVNEYRIHSFGGRSIRAGIKVVRDGFTLATAPTVWKPDSNLAHPWVKSFDAGWRLKYDEFKSTKKQRDLAHRAVKALELTFGAVDIGEMANGSLVVLEINRGPGVEGNTVQSYVRAINRWIRQEEVASGSGADAEDHAELEGE